MSQYFVNRLKPDGSVFTGTGQGSGTCQAVEKISDVYRMVREQLKLSPESWAEMKQRLIAEAGAAKPVREQP
jgi:hypothetical protein